MGDVPGDKNKGVWNGGVTKPNGYITKEEAKIFRQQEDTYDTIFSEIKTRDELVEREKLMKQDKNYEEIQQNHKVNTKPMHELYKGINKGMSRKTKISGMGGPQIKDSSRFNRKKDV
jgi:hypothetical protein